MAPPRWPRVRDRAFRIVLGSLPPLLAGCASPGPPRSPSLQLAGPVTHLSATRAGDAVELHFDLPGSTTDAQPLRADHLTGALCRQTEGAGACVPVDAEQTRAPLPLPAEQPVVWTDPLPPALRGGPPRVLTYRVELRNPAGRTAGFSEPVYVASGAAPPPVTALRAMGERSGIALTWTAEPGAGEVLLERVAPVTAAMYPARKQDGRSTDPRASRKPGNGTEWLQANPGDRSAAATVDAQVDAGVPYTYTAVRRTVVQLGGRTLELRSAPSQPVSFTWKDVYPPATPTGLAALGYTLPAPSAGAGSFAVDLIWQPVLDARLAGYLVYRQTMESRPGGLPSTFAKLTPQPIPTPGFHDATAEPERRYVYRVTAIDPSRNESAAATAEVASSGR